LILGEEGGYGVPFHQGQVDHDCRSSVKKVAMVFLSTKGKLIMIVDPRQEGGYGVPFHQEHLMGLRDEASPLRFSSSLIHPKP
jgi:hypothetical protein